MNAAFHCSAGRDHMRFALEGQRLDCAVVLDVPREDGLDLLEWLGLGRPAFGRIEARELAPSCRRRLWPIPRNVDDVRVTTDERGHRAERPAGTLRAHTQRLLACLVDADGAVVFG